MIFPTSVTHALRAVAFLATRGLDEPVQGQALARKVKVPAPYLAKVLAQLARGGVVSASRGVKGGYRLARPARDIRLIDVVEPLEGRWTRPGCLLRPGRPCREGGPCAAHDSWTDVKVAYLAFLERTTVEDIKGGASGSGGLRRNVPARRGR